jgi:hypothetical protein
MLSKKKLTLRKKIISRKNIISHSKHNALRVLYKYFTKIYKVMNHLNICFTKGTLIIDDNNNRLKKLLMFAKSTKLLPVMESHKDFKPYRNSFICGGICEINLHIRLKCYSSNEDQYKRNIKWYTFNNSKDKRNPERFVFIKFERYKSLSLKHGYSAFKRYVSKSEKNKSAFHRREDCKSDKNCLCSGTKCIFCKEHGCYSKYINDPEYLKVNNSNCFHNIDFHKRIGDELFINNIINDGILDSIKHNTNFSVENCMKK